MLLFRFSWLISVFQSDLCNWDEIATELDSSRTATACLQRYQSMLNPATMRTGWTPEEDALLRQLVMIYG